MKKKTTIIRWVGAAIFAVMAIYALSVKGILAALLFVLGGLIILPLDSIVKIRKKFKLGKGLSILLAVVLLFGGAFATPAPEVETIQQSNSSIIETADHGADDTSITSSLNDLTDATESAESNEDASSFAEASTESPTPAEEIISSKQASSHIQSIESSKQASTNNNNQIVYITATGKKYHSRKSCNGLTRAKKIYESTLSKAKEKGLEPCSKCY